MFHWPSRRSFDQQDGEDFGSNGLSGLRRHLPMHLAFRMAEKRAGHENLATDDPSKQKFEDAVTRTLKKSFANEGGATAIEYALIASLIAIVIIGALISLGTDLTALFTDTSSDLESAIPAPL